MRAFDTESWKEDALDALDGDNDHATYLGYLDLLLGLHRLVSGQNTYADLNDRITAFLIRNLQDSPLLLLETYPGEAYPVDNCFVRFADEALAYDLYRGIKGSLASNIIGFGAVREYPRGVKGSGDIDSGPIIAGFGHSATGFTMAGAHMFADR